MNTKEDNFNKEIDKLFLKLENKRSNIKTHSNLYDFNKKAFKTTLATTIGLGVLQISCSLLIGGYYLFTFPPYMLLINQLTKKDSKINKEFLRLVFKKTSVKITKYEAETLEDYIVKYPQLVNVLGKRASYNPNQELNKIDYEETVKTIKKIELLEKKLKIRKTK